MNKKDIGTVKRRLNISKRYSFRIHSCFLLANGTEVSRGDITNVSDATLDRYLAILKKVLSGQPAQTLLNMDFSNEQVMNREPEYDLLLQLRSTCYENMEFINEMIDRIRDCILLDHRTNEKTEEELAKDTDYLILLFYDSFDVRSKGGDDANNENEDRAFSYILGCVCPVKRSKPVLFYSPDEREFMSREGDLTVDSPEVGFMFPAYENGDANVWRAILHTKKKENVHEDYQRLLFGRKEEPMSSVEQAEAVNTILKNTLEDDCSMELIADFADRLQEFVEEQEEEAPGEIPEVGGEEIKGILTEYGISAERAERFKQEYDEKFGARTKIPAVNIGMPGEFRITMPDISIVAGPASANKISTQIINGIKYVTIMADSEMHVNGIRVSH